MLSNTLGLRYEKFIQNLFTVAKTGALSMLILLGLLLGRNAAAIGSNFSQPWSTSTFNPATLGMTPLFGLFVAIC